MVFSAEHYAPIVHNWVCWAAPVHDPVSGEQLGVIDLSTTWDRTHPIGLATARVMARLIETAMPASQHHAPRPVRRVDAAACRARPDPARRRRGAPRRQPAAAQPPADRDPRAARAEPLRALARAAARPALRRPGGHLLHPQGRGLPPAQRARRPARLPALPADDAGADRRQRGAPAAAQRPGACGRRGVRRRPDARHRVAGPRSSSPTSSPSPCARRCSPTRSRRRWPATPSSRPTTPR